MAAFPPSSSSSDQLHCCYYYSSSNLHFHYQSQTLQDIIKLPPNTINTITDDPNLITAHVPIANSSSSDSMLTHYCNLHPTTTADENFPTLTPTRKRKSKSNSNPTILQSLPQGKGKNSKKMKECEEKKIVKSHKIEEKKIAPDGYIHVRAKRGQATDSHSLAERVRREKISERMRLLQALVPGCDKVIGKALMLEEIINYVQSLQNQVEILSMKLASVDPMFYCASAMDLDTLPHQNLNNSSSMGAISLSAAALDQNPHFVNINSAHHVSHIIPLPHPPVFPNHLSQVLWEGDGQPQETINDSDIFCNLFSSLI